MALLNKTQAAKAINVSRQTLYQYIRQSRVSANADGMIDTAELLRAGFELRQPDMLEVTLSGQGLTVDDTPQVAENKSVTDLVDTLHEQVADLRKTLDNERWEKQQILDDAKQERDRLLSIVEHSQRLLEAGRSHQGIWRRISGAFSPRQPRQ